MRNSCAGFFTPELFRRGKFSRIISSAAGCFDGGIFFSSGNSQFGIFYYILEPDARHAIQAPLLPQVWTTPEIDFFTVSDDFEQKFFFGVQIFLDLEN